MTLKTLKMVQKLRNWLKETEQRRLNRDINVKINGIKISTSELPYFNQVEVVRNILNSLEEKEKLLLKEVEEVKESRKQIKNLYD